LLFIIFFYFLIPIHIKKTLFLKYHWNTIPNASKSWPLKSCPTRSWSSHVISTRSWSILILPRAVAAYLARARAYIYMFKIVLEWIFILFKRVKKGRHFFFFFFNYFYLLYSKIIIKRYPKLSTFLFMECPKPELTITNMRLL